MKDTAVSKTCDKDGTKMKWNYKRQIFVCSKCGVTKDNTAKDILNYWSKL